MTSAEHLILSSFIKGIHQNLRREANLYGGSEAWIKHCKKEKELQQYACAMQELALRWDLNVRSNSKVISRIHWIYNACNEYFRQQQILSCRQKEMDICLKNGFSLNTEFQVDNYEVTLKLLDVGSCYNPFKIFDDIDVFPIDIAPAADEVYKCDFISVPLTHRAPEIIQNKVQNLQHLSFHAVVFSLLLEYLPTPEHRLLCCQKAYKLLKYEGLLIIITPDSKHVGANAKYMKSWRYVLSGIGFSRIKYAKLPYIHCMVFRKCLNSKTSERWAKLHENDIAYDKIYIPQDFNDYNVTCTSTNHLSSDNKYLLQNLPYFVE